MFAERLQREIARVIKAKARLSRSMSYSVWIFITICGWRKVQSRTREFTSQERTFLAWIRTGLGLIGIDFAVGRFGLSLQQLSANESHLPTRTTGLSVWSGVTLVGLGVLVMLSSVLRHFQLIQELKSGTWAPGRVSRDGVVLGVCRR